MDYFAGLDVSVKETIKTDRLRSGDLWCMRSSTMAFGLLPERRSACAALQPTSAVASR